MSLLFSLLMKMDAGQAKAELRNLQGELAKGKTEVAGLGKAAAVADGQIDQLGAASERAAAKNRVLAQSQDGIRTATQGAAGSMGNLVANLNDVVMMMAAGQNPFQMAIQQGTQITQVIGPMGAAGALKAFGGAFMSMLSPINLATLGIIAFGGMAVQWLTNSNAAAASLEDGLGRLEGAVGDLKTITSSLSSTDLSRLREEYGSINDELLEMLMLQRDLALMDAMKGTGEAVTAMLGSFDGWITSTLDGIRNSFETTNDNARKIQQLMDDVARAATPSEALDAVVALRGHIESTVGPLTSLEGSAYDMARGLVEAESNLRQAVTQADRADAALERASDAVSRLSSGSPGSGWMSVAIGETNLLIGRLVTAAAVRAQLFSAASGNYTKLQANTGQSSGPDAVRTKGWGGGLFTAPVSGAGLPAVVTSGSGASGSSGRGGAGARAERDAVADLIEKLREEQQTLQETDPVKREMLKHRKLLAEASAAEKAEIEGLIRAEMQLKAVQQAREYAANAVGDFLDQIIAKGAKASDVLRSLAAQFLSMAARSVITGQGWFANLLGITGGLFDPKTAAAPAGAARAAAGYRPSVVGAAAGLRTAAGFGVGASPAAAREAPVINVHVHGATGNSEIREMTEKGIRAGLDQYNRHILPGRVQAIVSNPKRR